MGKTETMESVLLLVEEYGKKERLIKSCEDSHRRGKYLTTAST